MKKLILAISLCLVFFSLSALGSFAKSDYLECLSSDGHNSLIKFVLPEYNITEIEENGEKYIKIYHPEAGKLLQFGKPELPVFGKLIALPNHGNPQIKVSVIAEDILENIIVYPQQELQIESSKERIPFSIDRSFYDSSEAFPQILVKASSPAIMRDFRVSNISVCPFQYDPQSKSLRVIKEIEIEVSIDNEIGDNPKKTSHQISRAFAPIYESQILNYQFLDQRDDFQQPNYLFIYPNNSTVENYLNTLIDWKHEKGFAVTAVSTAITGDTNSAIKSYIQNAYNNWDNPPENICLVGDAGGSFSIPTWTESWSVYGGEGDHPYTQLEGNDILADAIIGRLSFNTTSEFQTILSKIINYEKNPYTGNTNWFNHTLLVGDPSTSGPSCVTTKINIKEMMQQSLPFMDYNEVYSIPFPSSMSSGINSGCSYFNYRGYYNMSQWYNSNTSNLNNGFMLPFSVIITCDTGSFEGTYDARSEYFLKAGTPSVPKGAIACVGTATSGTHTTFNNCVDIGIFYGLFNDDVHTPGAALIRGKLNLYEQFPDNPHDKVDIFSYWNNLMGDPAIDLWSGIPQNLNLSYESPIPEGSNYLDVQVTDDSGHSVSNAWVTFIKGDDECFATGWTDSSGNITLNFDAENTGTATLTVSKHDYKPLQESVSISQAGSFVSIFNYTIDDDNSGSSSGNNDGNINPGESIELKLKMKNYGSSTASSVYGTLNDDSSIVITDDSESYGNIPANTAVNSMDDFDFTVADNMLGGTVLDLDFTISSSGDSWQDRLSFVVQGPNLEYDSYSIVDGNDSILAPGESVDLEIALHNLGSLSVNDVLVEISSNDDRLTFTDSQSEFATIGAESVQDNSSDRFTVTADSQIIPGSQIACSLNISNVEGYYSHQEFMLNVGLVNSFDPLGPDSFGYYIYDDSDAQYSLAPIYSWVEIDGSGTNLNFNDSGDNGDVETISLPFNVKFYNVNYSSVSICSNGWISFGETEQYDYMNWHVPGPLGPNPMVAVFWDDLQMSSGDVFHKYDSVNHRLIIEWSEITNDYDNSLETFQIIIYDEDYYPTQSNNSEMLLQYKEISNVDQGSYSGSVSHGQFASVGIEDHTSYRGLEYTYDNDYPAAAKTLTNQTALFITTESADIVEPAQAQFDVDHFDITIEVDASLSTNLRISNFGEADLGFNISKNYDLSRGNEILRDSGGPDSYGYLWLDSNELGGPDFEWIDISSYGTLVDFTHNDQSPGVYPLDFTVNFYGTEYSSFRVNPNGWIGFGDDDDAWSNTSLPSSSAPRPAIFPFWDDLFPVSNGGSGLVYYHTDGDRLIVMFEEVRSWSSSSSTFTFEMILYANGTIKFQYLDMNDTSESATIGIQNSAGNTALQMVYNSAYVEDNLAIIIYETVDWLSVSPTTGSIENGAHQDINIDVQSSELDLGEYLCTLFISTNDPENSIVEIPVDLLVSDMILDPPQNVVAIVTDESNSRLTLTWNTVTGATHYNIYAADQFDLPFDQWTLIDSNITGNIWIGDLDSETKFYKVTAEY